MNLLNNCVHELHKYNFKVNALQGKILKSNVIVKKKSPNHPLFPTTDFTKIEIIFLKITNNLCEFIKSFFFPFTSLQFIVS